MTCLLQCPFSSPPKGGRVTRSPKRLAWGYEVMLGATRRRFKAKQMTLALPTTVIVRHSRENPRKCSILPLKGRPDLLFLNHPVKERPPLAGYVRLAADGPALSAADAGSGLLLLDGSWRWAAAMTRDFEEVPPRSL